ncbi:efflux RND transporter periplasmic adaptor subunit [Devosia chinhatensis]|uniref:Uncharacterized protein n=1 Tax=Devosia chinhatensis TaxID=429727 RepID=A0A0F5FIK4_9HYPH|nr:efflux RND transporter periplasmic adaptor subunit [Devosia chinhatensis]KKB08618.1 hypothetical protein VE26_00520 [Devosia chinhatensis]
MSIDPVPSEPVSPGAGPKAGETWVAQDAADAAHPFLSWFAGLQRSEPAFVWAGLFGGNAQSAFPLVLTRRSESIAVSAATLARDALAEGQFKMASLQDASGAMTALAMPLAGLDRVCVALIERKLVEASRLAHPFRTMCEHLSSLLMPKVAGQASSGAEIGQHDLSDADLLDLLSIRDEAEFAQALFAHLERALSPDQAVLATIRRGKTHVLRSARAQDPLPRGSRAGQTRLAALHAATRAQETLLLSWAPKAAVPGSGHGVDLVAVQSEDGVARAATLKLPRRQGGHFVWLGLWDKVPANLDEQWIGLAPGLGRLAVLLDAGRGANERRWRDNLPAWTDPRGWRLWAALASVMLVVWLLLPAPLHVTGQASLRSVDQRALVAPRDGFLSQVHVRAGERVEAGQLLAELDTRELSLRLSRIDAQINQAQSRRMAAMAGFNTAMVQVGDAEIEAMAAERALIALLLDQSRLVAEADAIIVSGDMAERVGTALRHGEPMFQLAPLDGYQVAIDIPQKDITQTAIDQSGSLKLTALPFDDFPIVIERISLRAAGEGGEPGFVALARIEAGHEAFRAGMQGVAQIETGQAMRGWVLVRDMVFWAQVQWWRWIP